MGTLTIATFLTLDGVYQGPGGPSEDTSGGFTQGGWFMPVFDEDLGNFINDIFGPAEAFLLGRKTYEIFAASWPQMNDPDDPVGSKLNSLPKYVASTTLNSAEWNNSTVLGGDVVTEVAKLKEQPGGELQIHGSGNLAQTLFDANLIDIFHFVVAPVVLGTGKRLFEPTAAPTALQLVESQAMGKGTVLAIYRPAGPPTFGEFQMEEGFGLPDHRRSGRRVRVHTEPRVLLHRRVHLRDPRRQPDGHGDERRHGRGRRAAVHRRRRRLLDDGRHDADRRSPGCARQRLRVPGRQRCSGRPAGLPSERSPCSRTDRSAMSPIRGSSVRTASRTTSGCFDSVTFTNVVLATGLC